VALRKATRFSFSKIFKTLTQDLSFEYYLQRNNTLLYETGFMVFLERELNQEVVNRQYQYHYHQDNTRRSCQQ
jgi:hypothetical protein